MSRHPMPDWRVEATDFLNVALRYELLHMVDNVIEYRR